MLAASDALTAGPGGRFHLTYADGVADLDLPAVVARHEETGATLTVTVVRPELNFGVADLDASGMVRGFHEKPVADFSVNGGFMVASPDLLGELGAMSVLEREPFETLAQAGRLAAAPHAGFWACMDTPKDLAVLEDQWSKGALGAHLAADDRGGGPMSGRRTFVTAPPACSAARSYGCCWSAATTWSCSCVTSCAATHSRAAVSWPSATWCTATSSTARFLDRAIGEHEIDSVFHLAAQTIVGIARRSPVSTYETNVRGTWLLMEACRTHEVQRVVVAASDKGVRRQRRPPVHRGSPAQRDIALRRQQGRDRPHHPLLRAHVRRAGGDHALREPLRPGDLNPRGSFPR